MIINRILIRPAVVYLKCFWSHNLVFWKFVQLVITSKWIYRQYLLESWKSSDFLMTGSGQTEGSATGPDDDDEEEEDEKEEEDRGSGEVVAVVEWSEWSSCSCSTSSQSRVSRCVDSARQDMMDCIQVTSHSSCHGCHQDWFSKNGAGVELIQPLFYV